MTPPKKRARSRLSGVRTTNIPSHSNLRVPSHSNLHSPSQNSLHSPRQARLRPSRQHSAHLLQQSKLHFKKPPLLYLAIGTALTSYILFSVQPASIRNIPVPDSYGPLLASIGLAIYGLIKFFIKSKLVSLILTFFIIGILSLKLQNFHDIL